jgi:catechol 2,3-dioxygenase-like lactoylglutathione lyase family enzyme
VTDRAIGCIDHVVIAVSDLDAAAVQYRKLGFTLSPKGIHSAVLGSANHTIMLQHDYFELLTVLTPTERNTHWRKKLGEGGGIAGIALTTDDAAEAHMIWSAAGFQPDDLIKFSRQVVRQDGVALEARFEVVSLNTVPETGVRVFVCSQPTREAVWLPELTTHANTAKGIKRVIIASTEPARAVAQWLRLIPYSRASETSDGMEIALGGQAIEFISHQIAEARFGIAHLPVTTCAIAIDYRVADIETCAAVLSSHQVEYFRVSERIAIRNIDSSGMQIGFCGGKLKR